MLNMHESVPLWFVFATIVGLILITGLGILAVKIKKKANLPKKTIKEFK